MSMNSNELKKILQEAKEAELEEDIVDVDSNSINALADGTEDQVEPIAPNVANAIDSGTGKPVEKHTNKRDDIAPIVVDGENIDVDELQEDVIITRYYCNLYSLTESIETEEDIETFLENLNSDELDDIELILDEEFEKMFADICSNHQLLESVAGKSVDIDEAIISYILTEGKRHSAKSKRKMAIARLSTDGLDSETREDLEAYVNGRFMNFFKALGKSKKAAKTALSTTGKKLTKEEKRQIFKKQLARFKKGKEENDKFIKDGNYDNLDTAAGFLAGYSKGKKQAKQDKPKEGSAPKEEKKEEPKKNINEEESTYMEDRIILAESTDFEIMLWLQENELEPTFENAELIREALKNIDIENANLDNADIYNKETEPVKAEDVEGIIVEDANIDEILEYLQEFVNEDDETFSYILETVLTDNEYQTLDEFITYYDEQILTEGIGEWITDLAAKYRFHKDNKKWGVYDAVNKKIEATIVANRANPEIKKGIKAAKGAYKDSKAAYKAALKAYGFAQRGAAKKMVKHGDIDPSQFDPEEMKKIETEVKDKQAKGESIDDDKLKKYNEYNLYNSYNNLKTAKGKLDAEKDKVNYKKQKKDEIKRFNDLHIQNDKEKADANVEDLYNRMKEAGKVQKPGTPAPAPANPPKEEKEGVQKPANKDEEPRVQTYTDGENYNESFSDFELMQWLDENDYEPTRENVEILREMLEKPVLDREPKEVRPKLDNSDIYNKETEPVKDEDVEEVIVEGHVAKLLAQNKAQNKKPTEEELKAAIEADKKDSESVSMNNVNESIEKPVLDKEPNEVKPELDNEDIYNKETEPVKDEDVEPVDIKESMDEIFRILKNLNESTEKPVLDKDPNEVKPELDNKDIYNKETEPVKDEDVEGIIVEGSLDIFGLVKYELENDILDEAFDMDKEIEARHMRTGRKLGALTGMADGILGGGPVAGIFTGAIGALLGYLIGGKINKSFNKERIEEMGRIVRADSTAMNIVSRIKQAEENGASKDVLKAMKKEFKERLEVLIKEREGSKELKLAESAEKPVLDREPNGIRPELDNSDIYNKETEPVKDEDVEGIIVESLEVYKFLIESDDEEFYSFCSELDETDYSLCEYILSDGYSNILTEAGVINNDGTILLEFAPNDDSNNDKNNGENKEENKEDKKGKKGFPSAAAAGIGAGVGSHAPLVARAIKGIATPGGFLGAASKTAALTSPHTMAALGIGAAGMGAGALAGYGIKKLVDKIKKEKAITKYLNDDNEDTKDGGIKIGTKKDGEKEIDDRFDYKNRKVNRKIALQKSKSANTDEIIAARNELKKAKRLGLTDNIKAAKEKYRAAKIKKRDDAKKIKREYKEKSKLARLEAEKKMRDKGLLKEMAEYSDIELLQWLDENELFADLDNLLILKEEIAEFKEKEFEVEELACPKAEAEERKESNPEPKEIQESVRYASLKEACLLDEGYFRTDTYIRESAEEKQKKLVEQIALLLARENMDPLYEELLSLSIKADRLQEACVRKYRDAAGTRANSII